MKTRYRWITAAITAVSLAFTTAALADSIILKNGHVLDGIIERETDSMIVLNFGVGSTSFSKKKIDRIIRSEDTERIRSHWREQNFYRDEYVPDGYEALAKRFRNVLDLRSTAQKSSIRVEAFKRMTRASEQEIDALQARLDEANKQLRDGEETLPATEFADLTKKIEELGEKIAAVKAVKTSHMENADQSSGSIAAYIKARNALASEHANAAQDYDGGPATAFLTQMGNQLSQFKQDFSGKRIQPQRNASTKPSESRKAAPETKPSGPAPGGGPPGFSPIPGGPPSGIGEAPIK